ncbi:MAG: hypothetical protein GY832_25330, partial [Chloroflexi bacterium]|nr:hypothetical protein [Chloroflexota bacterium]
RDHPREILHLNHEVDQDAPDYVEIQSPSSLAGAGEQTIRGFVSDQSAVPTIVLEIDGGEQSCQTGGGAQWSCDVDLGARNDGDSVALRVRAVDAHGQASGWFDGPALTVDTTAPVISNTNISTDTFDGGLVGPDDTLLLGTLLDNRLVDRVEVCEAGVCNPAQMLVDPSTVAQSGYTYDDDPAAPILIGLNNACSGGTPLVRTFMVSDDFVIADLDVGLSIEHAFRNDLDIWLQSPAGTRVQLAAESAAAANLDVTLDDAALRAVTLDGDAGSHDNSAPLYDNHRQPRADQLYAFRGESALGTWLLDICDHYPDEDEGLYNHSQLSFQAVTIPANSAASWWYNLDLPANVDQMNKTIVIYGYDSLGNRSDPIPLTFEIDTRAPDLSVSSMLASSRLDELMTADGLVSDANDVVVRLSILTPNGQFTADRTERTGNTWVYSDTRTFLRAGDYRVWVEAEDAVGNVEIVGPYQVERLPAGYLVYLPMVARNWDHSLAVFPNQVYLPMIVK